MRRGRQSDSDLHTGGRRLDTVSAHECYCILFGGGPVRHAAPAATPGRPAWPAPANEVGISASDRLDVDVVTRLSQVLLNRENYRGTARDGCGWSECFESHCSTTEISRCPTGVK